jgi:hypothetical protein
LLLDGGERARVLGGEFFRLPGKARDICFFDVIGGRLHELRLPARRRALAPRNSEIRQRQIGLEPARCRIEGLARHAERLRLRPQVLEPFLKRRISRPCRGGCGQCEPDTHEDSCAVANSSHVTLLSFRLLATSGAIRARRSAATIQGRRTLLGMPKKRPRYGAADASGTAGDRFS